MIEQYFPQREFAALLFDFDGTIADTMPAHFKAWNDALSVYNLSLSREQHLAWAGRPTRMILQLLNEMHKSNIPVETFLQEKEEKYFSSISSVREITSVVEIIRHYDGVLPMAIVSGSRRKPIETTLKHLKLEKYFQILVCAEDYTNGKPAPDCFLLAAKRLSVDPSKCLVFEDAPLGIESAKNAGMTCLKVEDNKILRETT